VLKTGTIILYSVSRGRMKYEYGAPKVWYWRGKHSQRQTCLSTILSSGTSSSLGTLVILSLEDEKTHVAAV